MERNYVASKDLKKDDWLLVTVVLNTTERLENHPAQVMSFDHDTFIVQPVGRPAPLCLPYYSLGERGTAIDDAVIVRAEQSDVESFTQDLQHSLREQLAQTTKEISRRSELSSRYIHLE